MNVRLEAGLRRIVPVVGSTECTFHNERVEGDDK